MWRASEDSLKKKEKLFRRILAKFRDVRDGAPDVKQGRWVEELT